MGKKKKRTSVPTAAQADPNLGEESEEDIFGEDEPDEFSEVGLTMLVLPAENPFEGLPLNQVPGKFRKFLTKEDSK